MMSFFNSRDTNCFEVLVQKITVLNIEFARCYKYNCVKAMFYLQQTRFINSSN